MTKMKSKKMNKSTFAIIIMALVMVAMIAFGGTYAYFTATADAKTETFKTAIISLNNVTSLTKADSYDNDIVPGQYLYGSYAATDTTTGDTVSANYQVMDLNPGTAANSDLTSVDVFVFAKLEVSAVIHGVNDGKAVKLVFNNKHANKGKSIMNIFSMPNSSSYAWTKMSTTASGAAGAAASGFEAYYFDLKDGEDLHDFCFKLRFDPYVQADRLQKDATGGTYTDTCNVGYLDPTKSDGTVVDLGATSLMGLTVTVSLEFAAIQQLGFVPESGTMTDADLKKAYDAAFAPVYNAEGNLNRPDAENPNPNT